MLAHGVPYLRRNHCSPVSGLGSARLMNSMPEIFGVDERLVLPILLWRYGSGGSTLTEYLCVPCICIYCIYCIYCN